jgi:hypothetical protein
MNFQTGLDCVKKKLGHEYLEHGKHSLWRSGYTGAERGKRKTILEMRSCCGNIGVSFSFTVHPTNVGNKTKGIRKQRIGKNYFEKQHISVSGQ